jgi:AraC-like DNA-binding protein
MEQLMNLFEVRVDAFAICEIERTAALKCDPLDKVVVHFVLKGAGVVRSECGNRALRPNSVIIVPRRLAKVISGEGPIETICDAEEHCPLKDQLIRFKAGAGEPDLVLGCAAVEASIGGVIDVFEHLWEPIFEDAAGTTLAPLFGMIERELASPHVGTRAIVGALMKQVLIGVFRSQLSREAYRAWLWPAMLNPQVGRAALAMMSRPQDHHSVDSLAALAGMSRSRFTEHFTNAFGRSPIEFLRAVRLRVAQRLLVSSTLPVKSIAAAVGYSSRSQFSRSFQAKYGSDPSAFRKSAQS